jgi:hypothetical protein
VKIIKEKIIKEKMLKHLVILTLGLMIIQSQAQTATTKATTTTAKTTTPKPKKMSSDSTEEFFESIKFFDYEFSSYESFEDTIKGSKSEEISSEGNSKAKSVEKCEK